MAHGGKRPGAGRRAGSVTTKTREIADKAAAEGITPLEVMLQAMRQHHAQNDLDAAAAIAKDAAPYMHPRLASIDQHHTGAIGQYQAVPVPVEEREPLPDGVESAKRASTGGDP